MNRNKQLLTCENGTIVRLPDGKVGYISRFREAIFVVFTNKKAQEKAGGMMVEVLATVEEAARLALQHFV